MTRAAGLEHAKATSRARFAVYLAIHAVAGVAGVAVFVVVTLEYLELRPAVTTAEAVAWWLLVAVQIASWAWVAYRIHRAGVEGREQRIPGTEFRAGYWSYSIVWIVFSIGIASCIAVVIDKALLRGG